MRKTRRRHSSDQSATTDIVSQLECAIRYPQATLIGALVGGLVPWFARTLAHVQLPAVWSAGGHGLALVMLVVVLGCAVFSGLTVYKFGRATFSDTRKALGFTLAIEGVMLVSTGATSAVALAVLILINALANGSAIALARQATCKKREATARATATRRSRAGSSQPKRAPFPVVDNTATPAPAPAVRWNPGAVYEAEIIPEPAVVYDAEIISETKRLTA
jgi:hypothetical protein